MEGYERYRCTCGGAIPLSTLNFRFTIDNELLETLLSNRGHGLLSWWIAIPHKKPYASLVS